MTLQDTQQSTYNPQIPYFGHDVFGDGVNSSLGYVTAMANRVSGPLTAMIIGQCSANAGEMADTSPSTTSGILPPDSEMGLYSWHEIRGILVVLDADSADDA